MSIQTVHAVPAADLDTWPAALTPEALGTLCDPTPVLVCDTSVIAARYAAMRACLPDVGISYAVKCNPSPAVLRSLVHLGAGFEIASLFELEMVRAAGGDPSTALYSNTVKPAGHIRHAYLGGVRRFGFDGEGELHKLAAHAPGSQVYVRLRVNDNQSLFPLSEKFGTSVDEACRLLVLARDLGLHVYGATFHVGSQCADAGAWPRAIAQCGVLIRLLKRQGLSLEMLDIGGGFPARYCDPVPEFDEIAAGIRTALDRLPSRPATVVAEPGRYLVAESGVLVATVIGVDDRRDGPWCYLDVGGYNGLMEAVQTGGRWRFPLRTEGPGTAPLVPFTVTGPSCDSSDTMFYGALLPADLAEGQRVFIGSTGAYTTSYASHFNGFPPPRSLFTDGGTSLREW
ncbi:MAG TPA: type III PLP-dependent enzyme [Acidimicrobiales bacterium]|nr:type III PLP-dependent enzyme [Acidimicrobiales bacterium]